MSDRSALPEDARHAAASALARDALPEDVLAAFADASWRVRKAALIAFEGLRHRTDLVRPLVDGLADAENAGLRSACAQALVLLGPAAVDELATALSTADVDQRKFVVEVLGDIGGEEAQRHLLPMLEEDDDNVRSSAVDALGKGGSDALVPLLWQRLASCRDDLQSSAYYFDALARLRARLPTRELLVWLARPGLGRLVYPMLGLTGDIAAIDPLAATIEHGPRGARGIAVVALERLFRDLGEDARAELLARLGEPTKQQLATCLDDDDDVAAAAVHLLVACGAFELAPRMIAAAAFRPFVGTALRRVISMGPQAAAPLVSSYAAADIETRVLILEVLESIAGAESESWLLEVVAAAELRTAEAAARVLAQVGGPASIEPLLRLLATAPVELSEQAALSLAQIGVRHPAAVAAAVRSTMSAGHIRPGLLTVLGSIGDQQDVEVVLAARHHDDPEVRRAAIGAFVSFVKTAGEETLALALTDEHASVRASAARALGAYPSLRAVSALLIATRDDDPLVVAEALRSLGTVGGEAAVDTLIAAAHSGAAPIAIAALQSLFRINPPDLERTLSRAVCHADPEVVCEALQASMRLPSDRAAALLLPCASHRSWHVRLTAVEMLAKRNIQVPEDVLRAQLAVEEAPLVREALLRLIGQGRVARA